MVFAGGFALPSRLEAGTNRYSPYPQVSNISTNYSWPSGQVLPTFATPVSPLDTILVQDLSPDEEVTFSALQGLINKSKPRIYLLDSGADEGTYTWANSSIVGFTSRTLYNGATRYNLVAKFTNQIAGLILYETNNSIHYRNLASTIAGLSNAIPVTPTVRTELTNRGMNLPVLVDLTTLTNTTAISIYNYLYTNYWPACNKRVIVSANPADSGDLHHTRDIAAATGGAVVWLSTTSTSERDVLKKFLTNMIAGDAIVLGWYTTERSGITTATSFGIGTIPADFYISGTVYGGNDHRIRIPAVPTRPAVTNKIYICLFISDGDNAQYVQRAMRKIWDQNSASRGIYPLNWTIAPGMVDLGPALLNYYYTTATTKDCFVAGPSGMGYIMPVNTLAESGAPAGTYLTSQTAADAYTRLTETYMHRAGLRVLTVWDNATSMNRASYERNVRNLYGATVQLFSGSSSVTPSIENSRVRFDRLLTAYASTYTALRDALTNQINTWNSNAPAFISAQASIWGEMKPNRIVDLCNELNGLYPGKLEFVRADHYFSYFNQTNNLPFNLCMAAQTTVTGSAGGGSATSARDGTPYTLWTSSAAGTRSLTFNFGTPHNLHRYVIRHAGDTMMSQSLNTRDFRFQVSADGQLWSTVDTVVSNTVNVTDVEFPLVTAQYARVLVDNSGSDGVTRIADVELYGRNPLTNYPPQLDPSFAAWMALLPENEKPPANQRGLFDAPANDGMSNVLKYALGLKPLTVYTNEGMKVAYVSTNTVALELTRARATTANIIPEGSAALPTWTPVSSVVQWQENIGSDRERVRYLIPRPAGDAYYLRIRVELNE